MNDGDADPDADAPEADDSDAGAAPDADTSADTAPGAVDASDADAETASEAETASDTDSAQEAEGASGPFRRPGEVEDHESRVLTYGVPFVAALLVAVGIAGVVLGGWGLVQPAVGGCDDPVISVSTEAQTDQRLQDERWAASVERLEFDELTPAEQRAFLEALESPQREGRVEGDFDNREAFREGVVVSRDGTERYATVVSTNECLSVDPLLLPLGAVTLLVGLVAFAFLWYRFGTRPPEEWSVG